MKGLREDKGRALTHEEVGEEFGRDASRVQIRLEALLYDLGARLVERKREVAKIAVARAPAIRPWNAMSAATACDWMLGCDRGRRGARGHVLFRDEVHDALPARRAVNQCRVDVTLVHELGGRRGSRSIDALPTI